MILPNSIGPIAKTNAHSTDDAAAFMRRILNDGGTVDNGTALINSVNRLKIPNSMGANKYDSASFVLSAAGGYKAGKLYALKPSTGAADPNFTRNGVAYRRNSLGLLEIMGIDVCRINYVPGNPKPVLLFEPSQINLFQHTEAFDNAYWTKVVGSISANAATGPDGNATADKLVDALSDSAVLRRSVNTTASPYVQYIHARAQERSSLVIFNSVAFATFDLSNGVVTETNFQAVMHQVNDYYLCALLFNAQSGTPNLQYANAGSGLGVSSGLNIWGAGLVQSRFISSHISSAGASTTRAVDNLAINNLQAASCFAANEGCFLLDLERMVAESAGVAPLTLRLANGTEVIRFVANAIANQYLVNLPTLSASSAYNAGKKIAVAWNGTNVRISQGGNIVATINGALGAIDQLRYTGNGLLEAYEILGYSTAPTNAELNALTA